MPQHIHVINSPHPSALLSPLPFSVCHFNLTPSADAANSHLDTGVINHRTTRRRRSIGSKNNYDLAVYSRGDGMTWLVISADARQIAPSHFTMTFDSTDTAICIFPRGIAPKLLTKISPLTLSSTLFHQYRVRSTVRIRRCKIVM